MKRWLSPSAILAHLALVVWVGGCAVAAVWQVGRAAQGNTLSYMYAVEWPVFGLGGIFGWWALLHVETTPEERAEARRIEDERRRQEAELARRESEVPEDPHLAAYNDHLARLADQPKKRLIGH